MNSTEITSHTARHCDACASTLDSSFASIIVFEVDRTAGTRDEMTVTVCSDCAEDSLTGEPIHPGHLHTYPSDDVSWTFVGFARAAS